MNRIKRLCSLVLTAVIVISMLLVPDNGLAHVKAAQGGTITVSVEKFALGQGYLIEPEQMTFTDGENFAQVFDRLMKKHGYTYTYDGKLTSGFYLRSIDHADTGKLNIPSCIQQMPGSVNWDGSVVAPPTNTVHTGNVEFPTLGEFAYCNQSGWYFFVNNSAPNVGFSGITVKDKDVVRVQFTVYGLGADLGSGYDGNETSMALNLPNRDEVTKKMAVLNSKKECLANGNWKTAYENAAAVVSNLDSTAAQVTAACNSLPTEAQIDTWLSNQAAQKQQESDKAAAQSVMSKIKAIGSISLSKENKIKAARKAYNALTTAQKAYVTNLKTLTNAEKKLSQLKKYTPKKTTLKTVKKSGKNKMKLTWKRISGCTGYQIFMSNKKSSGYKKIATIKKNKTISYTKTKLKKGKTYYFKVRTYKKVGKTTYYGSDSNVRKLKMK